MRPSRPLVAADLVAYVRNQLPRTLQERATVSVKTDAYLIKSVATFTFPNGTDYSCNLDNGVIPDACLAHLSVIG